MQTRVPRASRPYMPGYGTAAADAGLLPWSWAVERLTNAHDYWVATTWPDCRPHVMPVWGVWQDDAFWFSSSRGSRKARNLAANSRCVVTTDVPAEPVVIEGDAELVEGPELLAAVTGWVNAKYRADIPLSAVMANACFRVRPVWAFGLVEKEFTASPTRWVF